MVIFNHDIFDEDRIVWKKDKCYAIVRGDSKQLILENETDGDDVYGVDLAEIGKTFQILDA